MNRNGHIAALLLLVFAVCSCENFYDDGDEYDEAIAMVEKVTIDTVLQRQATIGLHCFAPNPCWGFSRIVEKRDSNQIHLTVYRKAKRYQTCIQVVSSFTHQHTISVDAPGTYHINIYRTPSATLDTTVVF